MGRQTYNWLPGTVLTREQVAQYAYAAGFRGQALVDMVAIAGRESGYKPGIHGSDRPQTDVSGDRGLWQINARNDDRLMQAGIYKDKRELFHPLVNAKAAYFLSNGGTNLYPWGVAEGGWTAGGDPFSGTDRPAAAAAVTTASQRGLFGSLPDIPNIPLPGTDWSIDLWPLPMPDIPGVPNTVGDILDPILGLGVGNPFEAAKEGLELVGKFFGALNDKSTWIRVGQVLGGAILLTAGIIFLVGPTAIKAKTGVDVDGSPDAPDVGDIAGLEAKLDRIESRLESATA